MFFDTDMTFKQVHGHQTWSEYETTPKQSLKKTLKTMSEGKPVLKGLVKSGTKYLPSMLQHKLTIVASYKVSNELNKNRFCGGFDAFLSEGKPML